MPGTNTEKTTFHTKRIVFMGTPHFALPVLHAIHSQGHRVVACYTRPPSASGRGRVLRPTPVHVEAERLGIPVHTPASLRDPREISLLRSHGADAIAVAAYGIMLPREVVDMPPLGCVNVHASLLPRWRGAAPIQRAIQAGDEHLGVSLMRIDAGMDTGPVCARTILSETPSHAGHAAALMAQAGAELMTAYLADPASHRWDPQPTEGITHAARIEKAEARLDFTRSAKAIARDVAAFNPAPGTWTTLRGERIAFHSCETVDAVGQPGLVLDDRFTIACGEDAIRPTLVQRAGRKPIRVEDLVHSGWCRRGDRME